MFLKIDVSSTFSSRQAIEEIATTRSTNIAKSAAGNTKTEANFQNTIADEE